MILVEGGSLYMCTLFDSCCNNPDTNLILKNHEAIKNGLFLCN